MTDIVLQEDQKLIEHWTVEFTGKKRIHRPADEWVECRVVKMYHSTIYGGANGIGRTVDEARLRAVLGLARAICDDETAFRHDADEIHKAEQLRWWKSKIQEENDYFESEEDPKHQRKIKRRINTLEQLMAEWQEDYDYWPEEADEHEKKATCEADRRSAVAALAASRAEAQRARASED